MLLRCNESNKAAGALGAEVTGIDLSCETKEDAKILNLQSIRRYILPETKPKHRRTYTLGTLFGKLEDANIRNPTK